MTLMKSRAIYLEVAHSMTMDYVLVGIASFCKPARRASQHKL